MKARMGTDQTGAWRRRTSGQNHMGGNNGGSGPGCDTGGLTRVGKIFLLGRVRAGERDWRWRRSAAYDH